MQTSFYPVSSDLADFVSGIIFLEGNFVYEYESLMTVKGTASMGIPIGKPFQYKFLDPCVVNNRLSTEFFDEPALFGQISTFGKVASKGDMRLAIVVFTPIGLYPFLQDDVSRYSNSLTPISQIPTIDFPDELKVQLSNGIHSSQSADLIEQYLKNHFKQVPEKFKKTKLDLVLESISQSEGLVTVLELVEIFGKSKRSLETEFKRRIGLSPKLFCRIVRFHAVYNQLLAASERDFFGLILKFRYADQSHFIKDFVEFTGFTPRKHLRSPFMA